ncbi:hypothetical protein AB5I41_01620 [Sphingomonas sp. MMS24-JH45]
MIYASRNSTKVGMNVTDLAAYPEAPRPLRIAVARAMFVAQAAMMLGITDAEELDERRRRRRPPAK